MSLTKVSYSMIQGAPVNVIDFGADPTGVTDSQPAFQAAVTYLASVGGGILEFDGIFKLDTPVTGITSNMTITGNGSSKIINGISSARGTADALFTGTGSIASKGTITADLTAGAKTVTVSTPSNFAVGDVVAFSGDYPTRNISVVVNISGSTLTLDRTASNTISSGSTIYKMTPLINTVIGDFYIDFNGTTASPRYGYGVLLYYAQDCRVQNIHSKNIGSKVVQLSGSFDCIVSNVGCVYGTDLVGDGGHSYLIRLAVCNDCFVENCMGNYLRHTVDMSGASRNTIRGCEGTNNYSATYLTHGNNCKDNIWQNNTSISSETAAYSFTTASGDTGNMIDGGYTENDVFIYPDQDGSTVIKNVTVKNYSQYCLTQNGTQSFENCTFVCSYPLITNQSTTAEFTFVSCTFKLSATRALASLSANTQQITINLNGCEVDCTGYDGTIFEGGSNTYLNLTGCNVFANQTASTSPVFSSVTKEINAYDSTFKFLGTGGVYFFGANTNTTLTIDGNRFVNSSAIVRRYTSGDVSMILGQNQYINSALPSFTNWIGLNTIGAVTAGLNAAPASGAWVQGAKVLFDTPAAGGNIGAVCTTAGTPGTWKTWGAVAA